MNLRGMRAPWGLLVVLTLSCGKAGGTATGNGGWTDPDASATDADGAAEASPDADATGCTPKSCALVGATCGSVPDGCDGVMVCGACPSGQFCGGGGPNRCGTEPCTPKTCSEQEASCGWASDGCSAAMDCGACAPPLVCGASKPNQCACAPKTCTMLGADCGWALDGCGGKVDCGQCGSGLTCGGGGKENRCGPNACVARTCTQLGASCGLVSDGCSDVVDCGSCQAPQTCGGAGVTNQCGCVSKTCAMLGVSCGTAPDGCGQELDCGGCGQGETCGGGGVAGMCGCTCTVEHATSSCAAGQCVITACDPGWADCDAKPSNGCEAELATDPAHCGACSIACSYASATPVCAQGHCTMGPCDPGWTDCDQESSTGCEIDTDGDPNHCGTCSTTCSTSGGTPSCWGGVCGIDCSAGLGDCNGVVADGCETNLKTSLHHCGTCSKDCASPLPAGVSTAKCTSGACGVGTCVSGRVDQNAKFNDGCECTSDAHPATCATAAAVSAASIPLGGTAQVSGNLVPTGDQDWFVATFAGSTKCSYHPRVELVDASGLARLVVRSSCDKHLSCSEGGTSTSTTTWEFTYAQACGTKKAIDPSKKESAPTTVRVGVFAPTSSTSCLPYTLKLSN